MDLSLEDRKECVDQIQLWDRFWFYGISGNRVKTNVFSRRGLRERHEWISSFCRLAARLSAGSAARLEFDAGERYCLSNTMGAYGCAKRSVRLEEQLPDECELDAVEWIEFGEE